MHVSPLIWCEDFREALPEFTEVVGTFSKFKLNFGWKDKGKDRISGNSNVIYFRNHVLVVCPRRSGSFLVMLFEAKLRNEHPYFRVIAKAYVDKDFVLDREGFEFPFGNGRKYQFFRRKRGRADPHREEYSRAKFKKETLALINDEDIVS